MNRTVSFLPLAGELIAPQALAVPRARQLYAFLSSGSVLYSEFQSAWRMENNHEAVVFDVEVEVGQSPFADILLRERVAAVFTQGDDFYPDVLALRTDFPHVPHVNLRLQELPRSLCLYEQSWHEVRVRWTAFGFVQRIREWLSLTSEGKLHPEDQPLEPILLGPVPRLVIPSDLFTNPNLAEKLVIYHNGAGNGGGVYTARLPGTVPGHLHSVSPRFMTTAFVCQPQEHGIIRMQPQTLAELQNLVAEAGLDLFSTLKERVASWQGDGEVLRCLLIILLFFPKTRKRDSEVEAVETWAFITGKSVAEIGVSLGVFGTHGGAIVPLIGSATRGNTPSSTIGEGIPLTVMNPTPALSRGLAATLNGLAYQATTVISAVGVGALGSQLIPLLIRAGYGKWTLIDDDVLLPHNVARHELTADAVGFHKAEAMSMWLNTILEEPQVTGSITANFLLPGESAGEIDKAMRESDVIVDLSASLAVSRTLAAAEQWPGRRVSLFLNPRGSDLILLAEDAKRTLTLDFLEMVYYREVVRNSDLSQHLDSGSGPIRYAQSCRDLTRIVPGELIAMHAAIGSRALRQSVDSADASIRIWLSSPDLSVSSVSIPCPRQVRIDFGDWTLIADDCLLAKISDMRAKRLPNETGGVLIGHFDVERKAVYVVEALGSPPDSKEWPTVYIRGAEGLSDAVAQIQHRTGTMLQYVGEWHSHPDGYSCAPSGDDKRAFAWLLELMEIDGYPGLMLIAGCETFAWFLGKME